MKSIVPTVFATNKKDFDERLVRLCKICNHLHVDFMDGKFVKSSGVKLSDVTLPKNKKIFFEAHLMEYNPEKKISLLKKKGFGKIIFHYEAMKNNEQIISLCKQIKKLKMQAFIGVNPETKINNIFPLLEHLDGVMLMAVHPGKEGQKFILETWERVLTLRHASKHIMIQIDGGVNLEVAHILRNSGANILSSGNFVSGAQKPKDALAKLKKAFR